jgi:hypothetical protein
LCVSGCRAQSIGFLFAEIESLVEKLFWVVFSHKNSPVAP